MSKTFEIRCYTKKELALMYFPDAASPHTAVNHLMAWVKRCPQLWKALEAAEYKGTSKWLTPKEVRLIVEHLGEP
ncbi:MAG: DUF4248 domain-containing protein [Bacteroidales bacterium]|nr:DUF4248 domain-containing protein [Candidatus Liminaster caballi]